MKKDFMSVVYNSREFCPFVFNADYEYICNQFDNIPIISGKYSIVIQSGNATNENCSEILSLHESPILTRHQLCVIEWKNHNETRHEMLAYFNTSILEKFIFWEEKYISMIVDHFKDRNSEGRALYNHNSIKIQTGKLISQLCYVKKLILHETRLTNIKAIYEIQMVASDIIKDIALSLHKLSGGRAFVQENIIEMLCLFEIFRKIYFYERYR